MAATRRLGAGTQAAESLVLPGQLLLRYPVPYVRELLDVRAGAERLLASARDHDRANGPVLVQARGGLRSAAASSLA